MELWCECAVFCDHLHIEQRMFFGHIKNRAMISNDVGKIVESEWVKTFEMRPDMNLARGEFIVMPNHFHGIIGIGDNEYNSNRESNCRDAMHHVPTNSGRNPKICHPLSGVLKRA